MIPLYLVTCFLRVTVSFLRLSQTLNNFVSPIHFPIKLEKGDEIVRDCDRYTNKTVTLRKHATKYKHMRKWIVDLLSKSESRGNKIARVNIIRIIKSIDFL